jgi:hypothetical protein
MNPERKKNLQKAYRNVTVVVVAFHPFVPPSFTKLRRD